MDPLDQLLSAQAAQGASSSAAPAPAATSGDPLDALLSAQANASASTSTAAPSSKPSAGNPSSLLHQLGLTARAGITGLTALPAMAGDALNTGVNLGIRGVNAAHDALTSPSMSELITGRQPWIPELSMPSQAIQKGINAIGLPQPANGTERVVQDAASAMAGVSPTIGLGRAIAGAASPTAQALSSALTTAPGMQMLGNAGAGAGSSGTKELGLGPGWQVAGGMLGGTAGILGGSLATSGVKALANALAPKATLSPQTAAAAADVGVDQAIKELGPQAQQTYQPVQVAPQAVPVGAGSVPQPGAVPQPSAAGGAFDSLAGLKQQVAQTMQQNPDVAPAAAMRSQDFRNLGIQPTLGQITRDPNQYAQELNMRGVAGVGSPLATRFNQQNTQLQQALYGLTGNAADTYQAGSAIKNSLQSIDSQMSQQVSDAYAAARASTGKNLEVPLTGLAQDYAQALNDFDTAIPSAVRKNFEQLGLMGGTQQKTFSIENAENLLKVINQNQGIEPATNAALGTLRNSVKNAILSADDQGGVYAPARAMAAQRFAMHEQIPALEASANGSINPDDFVRKYLIGGKTDQVNAMAGLLKNQAPDAFQEARNQLGAQLAIKGFGQNVAGDAPFKPAPFGQQMQAFGPAKLAAFYTPDEISQLNTIGRVGSYMNSFPSSAPVNTSNTASALSSIVGSGIKKIPYVGGLIDNANNRMFVNKALGAALTNAKNPSTPVDPRLLADALSKFVPPTK